MVDLVLELAPEVAQDLREPWCRVVKGIEGNAKIEQAERRGMR